MWTSTLHLEPKRVLLTKLLGLCYPDIYYSSFSPLQLQNLPRQPLPSASWVRVRNRLAGICGSDLHLIFADADLRIAPAALPGHQHLYPGHEVVGEVIEIGDDVQYLRVGDRVVLQSAPNCLSAGIYPPCRSCVTGNYNLCEQGKLPGPQPIGGGWSEEMLLHEQQLFRLPDELSDEQGVLLEPTAVALHAVLRHLPQPGEHVLIIGAGTIGLLTLQVIGALAPWAKVSMLARYALQREQARRMGASSLINPNDSYAEIQQITGAQLYQGIFGNRLLLGGYDVIYDTVGHHNTLHHVLRWARAQATIVLVGVSLHMMHIDLTPLWYQQINLLGTTSHGMETWPLQTKQLCSTFGIVAELMVQDRIHPEKLITHRFALSNYKDALITATHKARNHAIKVVFDYSLQSPSIVPNSQAGWRTPLPLLTSAEFLKNPQKLFHAIPYEHAKDALRQLRQSLKRQGGLSSTTSHSQPSSGKGQPDSEAVQTLQVFDICDEDTSPAIAIVVPTKQDQAPITVIETIPDITECDQNPVDIIDGQEFVDRDTSDHTAEIMASVEEEQDYSIAEMSPALTMHDEDMTPKAEIPLVPIEPVTSPEDLGPAVEMTQVTPVENGSLTDNKSESLIEAQEADGLAADNGSASLEQENGLATDNGSTSLEQVEDVNGLQDATNVLTFPEVDDTPVRVRSKRGKRKRKTKPF